MGCGHRGLECGAGLLCSANAEVSYGWAMILSDRGSRLLEKALALPEADRRWLLEKILESLSDAEKRGPDELDKDGE